MDVSLYAYLLYILDTIISAPQGTSGYNVHPLKFSSKCVFLKKKSFQSDEENNSGSK